MTQSRRDPHWKLYAAVSLTGILLTTAAAVWTRTWVLTALPIGFLFGFFLQKGDLCGSSAFSELLLMKDKRKLLGLWVVIVVAMVGFAVMAQLGWIRLNPKPFVYLNYLVGGAVFGVGMVLAGGCVSGCLYKAGSGNLNSIVALLAIPVGVMMVEFGPLRTLHVFMKRFVVQSAEGGVVTVPSLLGVPFWLLTALFSVATVVMVLFIHHRRPSQKRTESSESLSRRILAHPWKPWVSGLAIGLLMIPAYLSSAASGRNYPLGVTHGVMQAELLLVDHGFQHVWTASTAPPASSRANSATSTPPPGKKVSWWLVLLVSSLVVGSWVSGRMSGQAKLLPKPPDEIVIALIGGVLVGVGAAFATGCVVGNIMSGWALMSVGAILFASVTILANWATTYLYLMGARPGVGAGKRRLA
jgi:uncharacterized membrane protein YedE/YeeE